MVVENLLKEKIGEYLLKKYSIQILRLKLLKLEKSLMVTIQLSSFQFYH